VAKAIFGVTPAASGMVSINGKRVSITDPSQAIALGLAFVPEDRAVAGITRSAYGLSGQKCSALSRLYVHQAVADELIGRLADAARALAVGDPTQRAQATGPVNNPAALARYQATLAQLQAADGVRLHAPGGVLRQGALAHGHYAAPVLAEAPAGHPLWQQELFLPVLLVERVALRAAAMQRANASPLGLSAGFYGGADEVAWFHDEIEAGVTYANRAQGATTGAWPGYQPFGGWKGSSSTGKAIASFHYLPLYLREQSRTVVA
jgi:1-pyrroline-5-carboxylate dehydrogenase